MADPTIEERKAIEAFVRGTLSPLIEAVLTKKLSQAALFMRDELQTRKSALQRIAELLEDGEGPDLEDLTDDTKRPRLSAEERGHLAVIVRWARLPVDGVDACEAIITTGAQHDPRATNQPHDGAPRGELARAGVHDAQGQRGRDGARGCSSDGSGHSGSQAGEGSQPGDHRPRPAHGALTNAAPQGATAGGVKEAPTCPSCGVLMDPPFFHFRHCTSGVPVTVPTRPACMDVALNMLRETPGGGETKITTPMAWEVARYVARLEAIAGADRGKR